MKKVEVIIEKGKDLYAAYVAKGLKDHALNGTGASVTEAVEDLDEALKEMIEMYEEDGEPLPAELQDIQFEYKYDVASLFNAFDEINVSNFARRIGMNESLLRKYKNGLAAASEKQMMRIQEGFHMLAKQMAAIQL
jgi:predicted RNase H-like HicB family nuclease